MTPTEGAAMADSLRRVFIRAAEIPGLISGAVLGRDVSLRRLLGARRTGRYGVLLLLLAAVLALPPVHLPWAVGVHILASALGLVFVNTRPPLGIRQHQRLAIWVLTPVLLALAVLRLVGASGVVTAAVAVVLAHVLLGRGVRRGLGAYSRS